jgi:hypothetical protein
MAAHGHRRPHRLDARLQRPPPPQPQALRHRRTWCAGSVLAHRDTALAVEGRLTRLEHCRRGRRGGVGASPSPAAWRTRTAGTPARGGASGAPANLSVDPSINSIALIPESTTHSASLRRFDPPWIDSCR